MPLFESASFTVPGKWVLAGEHAVLHGAEAVALPHPEFRLELTFQPQVWAGLTIHPKRASEVVPGILEMLAREKALASVRPHESRGSLVIESTIPEGSGMGSSAALCVALARWASQPLGWSERELIDCARRLEDRFHGRSSGMDVAVCTLAEPIRFSMKEGGRALGLSRLPKFTFHDTGLRSSTRAAVAKVEAFRATDAGRGRAVDARMAEASQAAIRFLAQWDEASDGHARSENLRALGQAMSLAQSCFDEWSLVPPSARTILGELRERGALGAKITGAGDGGFVVALWG